ncbi:MAG TPA: polysaccharide lyase family 7 protein [Streptosporangiaceae bacterium]|nr:polysaccharide lyase family 7 protein [Streptosporangiaceae bacterium]
MRRHWRVATIGLAALAASAATVSAAFASVSPPQAAVHGKGPSLNGWNLVVPVDANGGTSGDAVTLSPARLDSPWLTRTSAGALDFWAPADGARLGISAHARTELRGTRTFTLGQGSANLLETTTVTQVPSHSQDIIIGQMFPSGTSPFAMLHYQIAPSGQGKVYGFIDGQSSEYVVMEGIPLGATFSDSIKANGSTVTFGVTYNGHSATKVAQNIGSFIGDTMHFQAGDYQQDLPGSPASDGGRVSFSKLSESGVS